MHRYLFLLLFTFSLVAKEVPLLTGPVVDQANLLAPKALKVLSQTLRTYWKQTGNQIQVLTIDSLEGEVLENYSIKVAETWKLGEEKKDNGLLFLIALKERKMRIEVGQGLEGVLPDLLAGRIIQNIKPLFKTGNYQEGIFQGTGLILKTLGAEVHLAPPKRPPRKSRLSSLGSLFFLIFLALIIFRRPGWILPLLIGMGSGRRHGGGDGFSGWSGGGGGFSGGGASGSW